jgi:hypothetical protein
VKRLELDFNDRNESDHVRVGPAAAVRHVLLRDAHAGERVEVVDNEGNRCVGTLVISQDLPKVWAVELDWSTWQDARGTPINGAALTDKAHSSAPSS